MNIIVVNWNAGPQLADTISSIAAYHCDLVDSIVLVDNASTDDSLAQVEALGKFPFPLQIIRNKENRGFGAACNQGARSVSSEFILFLNPDTRLFENSLAVTCEFMRDPRNSRVGIVGVQLLDEVGRISRSCARFPSLAIFVAQVLGLNRLPGLRSFNTHISEWKHDETRTVDHVIGAFYLIRRSLFESLGGFDERFFVYLEDLDLSLLARQAGYRSVFLADAQAFHAGGGTSRQVKAHRLFYSLRSRLLYGFKHFPRWQAWTLVGVTLAIEPVTRSVFSLLRGGAQDVRNTLRAYGMLIRDLPAVLARARLP